MSRNVTHTSCASFFHFPMLVAAHTRSLVSVLVSVLRVDIWILFPISPATHLNSTCFSFYYCMLMIHTPIRIHALNLPIFTPYTMSLTFLSFTVHLVSRSIKTPARSGSHARMIICFPPTDPRSPRHTAPTCHTASAALSCSALSLFCHPRISSHCVLASVRADGRDRSGCAGRATCVGRDQYVPTRLKGYDSSERGRWRFPSPFPSSLACVLRTFPHPSQAKPHSKTRSWTHGKADLTLTSVSGTLGAEGGRMGREGRKVMLHTNRARHVLLRTTWGLTTTIRQR